jgi:hypothetical protein
MRLAQAGDMVTVDLKCKRTDLIDGRGVDTRSGTFCLQYNRFQQIILC